MRRMPVKSRARKSRTAPVVSSELGRSLGDRLASERVIWLGFALAVLLFYARPLFDSVASIQWDAADEFYPAQKYFSDMLHAARLPFWTPNLFSGTPFLADPQLGAWYPLNWPFFMLGVTPVSLIWEIALHAFIALTGGYLLGRDLLENRIGAASAGILFAMSGFFAGHSSHTGMFEAAALLPWLLWSGLRALRSVRWLPVLAAASGLTVLAGHFQTALYSFFALGCLLTLDLALRRGSVRGCLQALGSAAAGAVLLSAVMALPGLELTSQSIRTGADYRRNPGAVLVPGALLTLVNPDHYGAPENENYTGPQDVTQFYFYAGILAVPLMLLGLVGSGKRWYALALIVPGAWYAFGPAGGLYTLIAQLPGFRNVRAPVQMWFVVALGIALAAGAGVQVLRARVRSPWLPIGLLAVCALDVWYWNMDHNNLVYVRESFADRYGNLEERFRAVAVPLVGNPLHRIWAPYDSTGFGPLDGFLNSGIEVTFGYNPLQLSRYTRYLMAAEQNPKLLDGLAVTAKLNAAKGTFAPNASALPRIYAPENVTPVRDSSEATAHLATLDPARNTFAEGLAVPILHNGGVQIHITGYTGDSYRARYVTEHPTFLRIAVPYFLGWQAQVDGKPAPVFPADLAMMGVSVPAGSHELLLHYHSTWFRTGAIISLLSWQAVLGWLYLGWRKPSSESRPI